MITPVKQHPLMEIIARKLSGIEGVPRPAQSRMVSAACHAARKWHEAELERLRARVAELKAEKKTWKNALEELTPGGSEFVDNPKRCADFVRAKIETMWKVIASKNRLVAELEAEKKTCRWHTIYKEEMPGTYKTECGHLFSFCEGDRAENDAAYCQYCGGEIVEARP